MCSHRPRPAPLTIANEFALVKVSKVHTPNGERLEIEADRLDRVGGRPGHIFNCGHGLLPGRVGLEEARSWFGEWG